MVQLQPDEMGPIVNRLRRAQGQLGGVLAMIDDGRDCEDIVTQLAAVSKAIDRAAFAVIAKGLRQCVMQTSETSDLDTSKLEKIFLSMA